MEIDIEQSFDLIIKARNALNHKDYVQYYELIKQLERIAFRLYMKSDTGD